MKNKYILVNVNVKNNSERIIITQTKLNIFIYKVLTAHISKASPLSGWKNIASGPRSTSGYFHSTGLHVTFAGASLEAPSGKSASDS